MIVDTDFHLKIIRCAENRIMYNICKWVFEQIYLKYKPEYIRENRIKDAAQEHKILFEALKNRDAKKAASLLREHIRKGREHIVGSLLEHEKITLT